MDTQTKINLLADLVAIQTVANHEKNLVTYLQKFLANYGIASELVSGPDEQRVNLVAQIGNGKGPVLAFSGHADTVHVGDVATWATDPFVLTAKEGKLYGRGTTDMKAGMAAFVIALIELNAQATPLNGTLRLLLTFDEELTQNGARLLVAQGYADDVDAMIIAEPTGVAITELADYFQSGGAVIAADELATLQGASAMTAAPEQHFIFHAHKGFLSYDVTATGKAAHSSMPKLGVNAIDHLVQYYLAEKALYETLPEVSPILNRTLYGPDVIRGGQQPNSVPDSATLSVMTRVIPELPAEELLKRLQELIDTLNQQDATMQLALHVKGYDNAVVTAKDNPLIQLIQQEVPDYLVEPMAAPAIAVSLGTDASQFIKANPNLALAIIGPGNTTAHKADEYVEQTAYLQMIDLYQAVAKRYLG